MSAYDLHEVEAITSEGVLLSRNVMPFGQLPVLETVVGDFMWRDATCGCVLAERKDGVWCFPNHECLPS